MGFAPFAQPAALALQAQTPVAGVALINAQQPFITWTAPNDGAEHRVLVFLTIDVTVTEVGGQIDVTYTAPDGTVFLGQLLAGALAAGVHVLQVGSAYVVKAGTAFTVQQQTALTGGAAVVWVEIWAA
jgi:hypothetical protein